MEKNEATGMTNGLGGGKSEEGREGREKGGREGR